MDYRLIPIQNIINSGNIENSLNRILQMHKSERGRSLNIKFVDESTVTTPPYMVDKVLDALPSEIWNHNTRFLNLGCKDGIFLVKLFQRLMDSDELRRFEPDETKRAWYILENQLFAVCVDKSTASMLGTLLYGMSGLEGKHITWLNTLNDIKFSVKKGQLGNLVYNRFIETGKISREDTEKYMKFDIVIGNPPYQSETDKKLYCKFMLLANLIAEDYTSMIVKNKWLTSVDKDDAFGFNDVRKCFLTSRHCRLIADFPVIGDIFEDVGTSVCYYLYDKNNVGDCRYIKSENGNITEDYTADFSKTGMVLKSKIVTDIANKTYSKNNFSQLDVYIKPCGFETADFPSDIRKEPDETHNITYITSSGKMYTTLDCFDIRYHNNIKQYNIVAGQQVHAWEREPENVITSIYVVEPNVTCSGTWTQLFSSDDKTEVENFSKYLHTKFCRLTIKAGYSAYGRFVNEYMRFCPMQDFTSESDIDWSQSIKDIDKQLYKKYNLTQEEIDYIEKSIKSME